MSPLRLVTPAQEETRRDLRRLGWCLLLVWLVLGGALVPIARVLGWPSAIGLVATVGLMFTLAILAAAVLPLLVDAILEWHDRGPR